MPKRTKPVNIKDIYRYGVEMHMVTYEKEQRHLSRLVPRLLVGVALMVLVVVSLSYN